MTIETPQTAATLTGAASVLGDELGELVAELDAVKLHTAWGEVSSLPEDAADSIRKLNAAT